MKISSVIVAVAIASFFTGAMAADSAEINEIKLQRLVRSYVSQHLKDPDSAKFRNQHGMCGEVNAKNGFGGYTGYVRFMAASEDRVFMEDDARLAPGAFDEAWGSVCSTSPTGVARH